MPGRIAPSLKTGESSHQRRGVQLRDPGASIPARRRAQAVDRPSIPMSSVPGYQPPSPRGPPSIPRRHPGPRVHHQQAPNSSIRGMRKEVRTGASPRPGDIVHLQNSPRGTTTKIQRLPPAPPGPPAPPPRLRWPMPLPPTRTVPMTQHFGGITPASPAPPISPMLPPTRQSLTGPRPTPVPRAGVTHVPSFRAAIQNAPLAACSPSPSSPAEQTRCRPANPTQYQALTRKSTVREPRPPRSPLPSSSGSSYGSSAESWGTLHRRRAVSRMSRTSASSTRSRPRLPSPPAPTSRQSINTTLSTSSRSSGSDGSPDLTLQWLPDPETHRTGSVDQAEATWARMEERMGKPLRDRRRERGRWIVTPRLGAPPTPQPGVGSVGFPNAVPTGDNAISRAECLDNVPLPPRRGGNAGLMVEVDPDYSPPSPERDHKPSRSASSTSSTSSGFTFSAYLDDRVDSPSCPNTRPNSPGVLEGLPAVPAMFDMTQPLISHSIGKTPLNTPQLNSDTLKRGSHVSKRRDPALLGVEYLGGGGMLVREESLRSVISRADAVTARAVGEQVKLARVTEAVQLDAQVEDARLALATTIESMPPSRSVSPLSDLIVDYVASPPVAVQWAQPIPRLPLPTPIEEAAPHIPTPRSIASVALEEMYDFLEHHQGDMPILRARKSSPKPQYTDRIYGSPESADSIPRSPPLPAHAAFAPRSADPSEISTPDGLGLGIPIRLSSVYGVPSLASARVRLLSPRLPNMADRAPLPFAPPESAAPSPILDFSLPEAPPAALVPDVVEAEEEIQMLVIKDLDTGRAVNIGLGTFAHSPGGETPKEKKWWNKKFFK